MAIEIPHLTVVALQRKLERWQKRSKQLHAQYDNNEQKYTFHAGFDTGYADGMISILEDILDVSRG